MSLHTVFQIYNSRGFQVVDIHGDNEFHKIENDILPVRLHCCGVDDHVPEIERSVQTQKNENRTVCHAMPYSCMPRLMVRELIQQGNEFLNAFGTKDSVADGLTPRNIIDNLPHVDFNDLKYEFGQYVQLHVTERITNTMRSRAIGAIVLGPRKIQGRYNYMSLETGQTIDGRVVAISPITDAVIARVEALGLEQNQPYRLSKMLKYEWRPGRIIDDDDAYVQQEDAAQIPGIIPTPIVPVLPDAGPNPFEPIHPAPIVPNANDTINPFAAIDPDFFDPAFAPANVDALPGADLLHDPVEEQDIQYGEEQPIDQEPPLNQGAQQDEVQGAQIDEAEGAQEDEVQGVQIDEAEGAQEDEVQGAPTVLEPIFHNEEEEIVFVEDGDETYDTDEEPESRNEERERRSEHFSVHTEEEYGRGKREKIIKSHSFLQSKFVDLKDEDKKEFFEHAWKEYHISGKTDLLERYTTGLLFAQMTAKQGIKKYGKEAEIKLIAEFKQLMEYKTFHGKKASDLTMSEKRKAANMINMIEEKINRGHTEENPVIKGRSVFNGRVQRGLYTKEETASPTVSQDAFFLTSLVDVKEGRDVAVTDIKGAYLNARMKDVVYMKITGPEVDLFCQIDPSLKVFVTYEKGKKVLYVQLDKALYGCVQSALLWYDLYATTLKDMGFELNPYDLCVGNAMIEGTQCTVCWYVDDNKISHINPKVIDDVIVKIEKKFGTMSKTRGENHDFLGMEIKFKKNKLTIGMKKHTLKAINSFMDDITRNALTPAKANLFVVNENAKKLDEKRAENFHSVNALLLFISRRCRLDIQTAVGFLCTRVAEPDEDDWLKLKRVLQYLRGTLDFVLTLGCDDITKMNSWVDVSYGIHNDCKSHTGGCISFGWGVLLTKCQKQKLNTKSSTEGEIVGVSDFMPNMIWARMFLEAQGFVLKENILHQDNQSAIKIVTNGKRSSGQKTKHMDNRYFWIKDRLESEGIKVRYCPTGVMLADFFTKPLQGNLFRKFRAVVLGYKHIDSLVIEAEETPQQERVSRKVPGGNFISSGVSPSSVGSKQVSWADVVRSGRDTNV